VDSKVVSTKTHLCVLSDLCGEFRECSVAGDEGHAFAVLALAARILGEAGLEAFASGRLRASEIRSTPGAALVRLAIEPARADAIATREARAVVAGRELRLPRSGRSRIARTGLAGGGGGLLAAAPDAGCNGQGEQDSEGSHALCLSRGPASQQAEVLIEPGLHPATNWTFHGHLGIFGPDP